MIVILGKKIQNGEGYWHVNQLVMPQAPPQNKDGFSCDLAI